mgnify:FL=1
MKIQTTRFGEIEVDDKCVFNFTMPILGYNEEEQFVMIESKEASLFKWIQSTHTPDLAFPATVPSFFGIDYTFELPDEAEEALEVKAAEDLVVMNIAKIPSDNPRKTTVNLLAPIVFNITNNKAGQVVLSGTGFDVTYPLFKDEEPKKDGE